MGTDQLRKNRNITAEEQEGTEQLRNRKEQEGTEQLRNMKELNS
jgi:hypothetical protein